MTTDEIINQANVGGLAGPDLDLSTILREKVLPEFLTDIRSLDWRRCMVDLPVAAGDRKADLPLNCEMVIEVYSDVNGDPLEYIGEDPRKVMAASSASVGTPGGYLIEQPAESGARIGIALDCPTASALTLYCWYAQAVWLAEDGTNVDLDSRMPRRWHWALVEGLKREIYRERFGESDTRYSLAAREFEAWKARAAAKRESGPQGAFVKTVL